MNGQIKLLREARVLTQKDLAKASGVNQATVYRVEAGLNKPRPSTIRKLAKALGVEPIDLMVGRHNANA